MKFLDEINTRAESIASVNCIIKSKTKIIGNNTDWYGFSMAMNTNQIDVSDKEKCKDAAKDFMSTNKGIDIGVVLDNRSRLFKDKLTNLNNITIKMDNIIIEGGMANNFIKYKNL